MPSGAEDLAAVINLEVPHDMVTYVHRIGCKDKLRAGDILGALTGTAKEGGGDAGLDGKAVGKIDVMDYEAYVSVERKSAKRAFARLSENKSYAHTLPFPGKRNKGRGGQGEGKSTIVPPDIGHRGIFIALCRSVNSNNQAPRLSRSGV